MKPAKIAVLSDTHNALPDKLLKRLQQADEIWHLGDVCRREILAPLRQLSAPLTVVKGNCDHLENWPQQLDLERHGHTFRLQHHPPRKIFGSVDAILYGHLHKPFEETWQGVKILNPGAVSGPRSGSASSFAWITFQEDGSWSWELETV